MDKTSHPQVVAHCLGVDVPASPFLHEKRIARINAARYERQEISAALKLAQPDDKIVELGAGLGIVGAVVARNAQPERVLSYEANPALIPHIQTLYEMNGLAGICSVRNQVLVSGPERPTVVPFHIHNSYLGSSLSGTGRKSRETVDVPTASFDEVCEDLRPDMLILDIEGGELELLEGADMRCIRSVVIEFHPKAYGVEGMRRCKNLLRDCGFEPVTEVSTRLVWGATRSD